MIDPVAQLDQAKTDVERGRWSPTKREVRIAQQMLENGPPYRSIPDFEVNEFGESRFLSVTQPALRIFQIPRIHEEAESREQLQAAFENFLRTVVHVS